MHDQIRGKTCQKITWKKNKRKWKVASSYYIAPFDVLYSGPLSPWTKQGKTCVFMLAPSHHHDTTATTVCRMAHRFDKEPSMKIRSKVDGGNLSSVNAQQRSKPLAGIPFHWLVHWDPSIGASQYQYNGYNHRLYTANNQGHRTSWCTFLSCPQMYPFKLDSI